MPEKLDDTARHDGPASARGAEVFNAYMRELARAHRHVCLLVIGYLVVTGIEIARMLLPELPLGALSLAIGLPVLVAGLVVVFKLALLLHGGGTAVLCALGLLVPLVALVVLGSLGRQACELLRAAGYRVGLLGADLRQFR